MEPGMLPHMCVFFVMWLGSDAVLVKGGSLSKSTPVPLVALDVYYETLCPDCMKFIVEQLYPTVKAVGAVMNISLIPYGFATETLVDGKWVFECQHGRKECKANLIQTCAIHLLEPGRGVNAAGKDVVPPIIRFVYCMESEKDPSSAGPKCAKQQKLKYGPIESCTKGTEGNHLQHQMAQRTAAENPDFVDWLVVNGVNNETIQDRGSTDLLGLICDSYTGKRPSGCGK